MFLHVLLLELGAQDAAALGERFKAILDNGFMVILVRRWTCLATSALSAEALLIQFNIPALNTHCR